MTKYNFSCKNTLTHKVDFNFPYVDCDEASKPTPPADDDLVCTLVPKPAPTNGNFDFTCRNTFTNNVNFNFPYQSCDVVEVCVGGNRNNFSFDAYAGSSGIVDQEIELVGLPIRDFVGYNGQQVEVQFGTGKEIPFEMLAYTGTHFNAHTQYSTNLAGTYWQYSYNGIRSFAGQDAGARRHTVEGYNGNITLTTDHTFHELKFYAGQSVYESLSWGYYYHIDLVVPKFVSLPPQPLPHGQHNNTDLLSVTAHISTTATAGAGVDVHLETQIALHPFNAHIGEEVGATLQLPVILSGFNAYASTQAIATLAREVLFDFGGGDGDSVTTEIYQPPLLKDITAHTGTHTTAELNRYTTLTGFNATKGTTATLTTLQGSDRQPITLATGVMAHAGQEVHTTINTSTQLKWVYAYSGAYAEFELGVVQAIPLPETTATAGASVAITNLSKTLTIKRVENIRFGQQVEFLGIEELVETRPPKPQIFTGEYLPLVHLRTEIQYTDLPLFHSGCEVTAELEVKPAPSFEVDVYAGQDIWVTLDRLKAVTLRPYNITSSSWFNVEMDNTSTIFGMCKRCEPLVGCTFEIMFDRYDSYLWETSANIATKVDINLATHSRLYFDAYAGQYAESRLFNRYLPLDGVEMYAGQTMRHNTLLYPKSFVFDDTADIPDADSTDIDLTETNARPFLNWATTGQHLDPMLSATPHIKTKAHSGQMVEFKLINWVFPRMYHGQHLKPHIATTIRLEFTAYYGSGMVHYEPPEPIPMYHGQTMEVRMQIDYGVDFEEIGCVSNEYIKFLDNGEPDYENSTPHAIEFERFEYTIRGICY